MQGKHIFLMPNNGVYNSISYAILLKEVVLYE